MIQFELTFVQVERCAYPVSRTICLRGFLFSPVNILVIFVKNQVAVTVWVYFSILYYIGLCVCFVLLFQCSYYLTIWEILYKQRLILCTLCVHFLSLSITFSVFFHIMSWISNSFLLWIYNIILNVNQIFSDFFACYKLLTLKVGSCLEYSLIRFTSKKFVMISSISFFHIGNLYLVGFGKDYFVFLFD